jgi:4'-phosphopantetheinyl transferase
MPLVCCDHLNDNLWQKVIGDSRELNDNLDIWRVYIPSNKAHIGKLQELLQPDEMERAARYYHKTDTDRFLIARGMLRVLLGMYLNRPPVQLQFAEGANKKPFVCSTEPVQVHYNVSHSGDWILIAVANMDMGIDVEKINPDFNFSEILGSCFSLQEIAFIANENLAANGFYRLWTRKEALLKATSKGIDNNLTQIPCTDGKHEVAEEIIGSPHNWIVSSFEVENQYVGSIAHPPATKSIRFFDSTSLMTRLSS